MTDFIEHMERFVNKIKEIDLSGETGHPLIDVDALINEMDLLAQQFPDDLKNLSVKLGDLAIMEYP